MMAELIKHKEYFCTQEFDGQNYPQRRTRNRTDQYQQIIALYEGCDGGKTGYTTEALHCLCATAKRNNLRLISAVIGAPDSKTRFAEVSKLFNYGFANYENKILVSSQNPLEQGIEVIRGKKRFCRLSPNKTSQFSKPGRTS